MAGRRPIISPDKSDQFPYPRRVYVAISSIVTGFAFLSRLTQNAPPSTRFVFPVQGFASGFLPTPPHDDAVASGSELASPLPPGDFHPQAIAHAGRTQGGALRSAAPGRARAGLRPWGADPSRRAGQPGSSHLLARSIGSIRTHGGSGHPDRAFRCPGLSTTARMASSMAAVIRQLPAASAKRRSVPEMKGWRGKAGGGSQDRGTSQATDHVALQDRPAKGAPSGRVLRMAQRPLDSPALPGGFGSYRMRRPYASAGQPEGARRHARSGRRPHSPSARRQPARRHITSGPTF